MAVPALPLAIAAGVWVLDKVFTYGAAAVQAVRNNIPLIDDQVTVEVVGQPGASKQELYFLALAAANGVVRRMQPLSVTINNPSSIINSAMGLLMIEYDAASNWVRCTIRYRMGTLGANVQTGARRGGDFYDNMTVYRGPQCEVVGGKFDFVEGTLVLQGIPINAANADAPKLPWAGREIVTGCPKVMNPEPIPPITQRPVPTEAIIINPGGAIDSPNPKPPGDNRSRGQVVRPVASTPFTGSLTSTGSFITGVGTATDGIGGVADAVSAVSPSLAPPPPTAQDCCERQFELVQLVFAALTDPGSTAIEFWAGPTPGPTGS